MNALLCLSTHGKILRDYGEIPPSGRRNRALSLIKSRDLAVSALIVILPGFIQKQVTGRAPPSDRDRLPLPILIQDPDVRLVHLLRSLPALRGGSPAVVGTSWTRAHDASPCRYNRYVFRQLAIHMSSHRVVKGYVPLKKRVHLESHKSCE